MSKIKNILIFVGIGLVFVLIYIFFIKSDTPEADLISSGGSDVSLGGTVVPGGASPAIAADFLSLLLNVKNIKLNDNIFADVAFNNLRDSSIVLIPDGNEGRPNPFAPIGTDSIEAPLGTIILPNPAP